MKTLLRRLLTSKGFTLIELLTVIAIIGILMALLIPTISSVKDSARRTEAKNDVTQIVTGVHNYYTEYGKYPIPDSWQGGTSPAVVTFKAGGGASVSNADQAQLMNILRADGIGWDSTSSGSMSNMNPRRVVYLEVPYVKDITHPRGGIEQTGAPSGFSSGCFYDPWGTGYYVFIDCGYTGEIQLPAGYVYTEYNSVKLNVGVAVESWGKDLTLAKKTPKSSAYAGSDDIVSWQ